MVKPQPQKRYVPIDMSDYENLDVEWRKIGLSAPARKALIDAKFFKVSDLRRITEAELSGLEGMSRSAIARLKVIMEAKRIRFAR